MSTADYSYRVTGNRVHIFDEDRGGRSVTNDAEQVIARIGQAVDLTDKRVTYTDSMGQVDRIQIDDTGRFAGFAAGDAEDAEHATRLRTGEPPADKAIGMPEIMKHQAALDHALHELEEENQQLRGTIIALEAALAAARSGLAEFVRANRKLDREQARTEVDALLDARRDLIALLGSARRLVIADPGSLASAQARKELRIMGVALQERHTRNEGQLQW